MIKGLMYEIETRLYFESPEEAFDMLPFLKGCLKKENQWETKTYGIELFNSGRLLRVSNVISNNIKRMYWGYKDSDVGETFNIRQEIDEDITDGKEYSRILEIINGTGQKVTASNVNEILESLGYKKFMSFTGNNMTGWFEKLQLALKLMYCPILEYSLLLEVEKNAATLEDALRREADLKDFIHEYGLENRVVKKEPPTLLFEKVFNNI